MIVCIDESVVFIIASGGSGGISVEGKAGTRAELLVLLLSPPHLLSPPPALPHLPLEIKLHGLFLLPGSCSAVAPAPH